MENHLNKVDFSFIRYANVWEDADVLLEALQIKPDDRVLSIASAGDNAFSLLVNNPALVVAVDLNPVQLYLVELKMKAIESLSRAEYLAFVGFKDCTDRKKTFQNIAPYLSEAAFAYWNHHIDLIEKGVVHQGKFEKYLATFATKVLPWIHSKENIDAMFVPKDDRAQQNFFQQKWNNFRWKFLFKIFFSKRVMGFLGRDPSFLKEVKVNVGSTIYQKSTQHLSQQACQQNHILHYCLKGNFGDYLPHYIRAENYEIVKTNLHKLRLMHGYAQAAIEQYGPFDCFNLSNIFEYMDQPTFKTVAENLKTGMNQKARIAYWNLMVPRRISILFPSQFNFLQNLSQQLFRKDKGFFYDQIIVEQHH